MIVEHARAYLTMLVLLAPGCLTVKPQPPVPPVPEIDPSPACQPPEFVTGCYHRPPGEDWQFIPEQPPAPPSVGCVLSGAGPLVTGHQSVFGAQVNAVMSGLTGCDVGVRCIIIVPPQSWQGHVAAALRERGLCAGQHAPDTDEIAVSRAPGDVMESYHIYAGDGWDNPSANGTVVWSPGADRPAYAPGGAVPPPTPPPTPPTAGVCGDPTPPPLDRIALGRLNARTIDSTPLVYAGGTDEPPSRNFCARIGLFNPDGITGRLHCPPRAEGQADREACEAFILGGAPVWTGPGWVSEDNPLQYIVPNGATGTVTACGRLNHPGTGGPICSSLGL